MVRSLITPLVVVLAVQTCMAPSFASACTGITVKPQDGSIIFARTLEFAADLESNVIVVPRGMAFTGQTPNGEPGLPWKTDNTASSA